MSRRYVRRASKGACRWIDHSSRRPPPSPPATASSGSTPAAGRARWSSTTRASCWVVPIEHGAAGAPQPDSPTEATDTVVLRGSPEAWTALLSSPPPPGYTDPFAAAGVGAMTVEPPPADAGRHLAVRRFVELLRHAANGTDPAPVPAPAEAAHGEHDAAVGRYVHLQLDGLDHRIYYETAGQGIGLLCQHTAGADGRQWRRLLEDAARHRPLPGRRLRPPRSRQVAPTRRPGLVGRAVRADPAAGHGAADHARRRARPRPAGLHRLVGRGDAGTRPGPPPRRRLPRRDRPRGRLARRHPGRSQRRRSGLVHRRRPGQPRRHDDDDHVAHGARGEPPRDAPALRPGRAGHLRRRHPLLRHRARPARPGRPDRHVPLRRPPA